MDLPSDSRSNSRISPRSDSHPDANAGLRSESRLSRRRFSAAALAFGAAGALARPLAAMQWFHRKEKQAPAAAPQLQRVTGLETLRAHAAARGLFYGAAVVPALLDVDGMAGAGTTDGYTQLVGAQCGMLVAENQMKWAALRPTPDTFDFSQGDRLLRFADLMGQRVRGHNLCWHEALPAWFKETATKDNARQLLTDHIRAVAGHFRGRLQSWDVVNEAVEPNDGRPDGLRKSPWLELIGPEYLEIAFTTAAEADPSARLVYNDYGIEIDTPEQIVKRGQVLLLVRRMKARGIPVHAVGVQSHLQAAGPQPGDGLREFLRECARLGVEVYVTEMDVNTKGVEGGQAEQDAAVARVYQDYLGMVLAEPNVPLALTWGITSAHTWLNESHGSWAKRPDGARQRPLPFDDDLNPTPAFYTLRGAIDRAHISAAQPAQPSEQDNLYKPFPVQGSPTTQPPANAPQH